MATIRLENVSFSYPSSEETTLRDLHLTVEHGSTHALLGASGAGKTTLLNLLSGLLHPSEGNVFIDDRDVSLVGARERNVALVFQFPVLYESKSVLANLTFPLLNRGWSKVDAKARALEIAKELEIDDVVSARPGQLSLFQKQLAAIGKSLVRTDVDLVLLDEPLTAVEPAMKWRLRQTLSKFQKHHGLTMIYVTHDQTEALTFASEVSVLANGAILQTGTPTEIYDHPANTFVGNFIGSPGMRFVGKGAVGTETLTDLEFEQPVQLERQTVGLRSEWLDPRAHGSGAWEVTGSRLLGTRAGEVRSLLTLTQGAAELLAEGAGAWSVGSRATLRAKRHAVIPAGDIHAG
ncbi:MAG: ABC transporter ATP-binding protein [Pseudomonadota bacterium]